MEKDRSVKILIHSAYPLYEDSPNGVACFIREIKPFLIYEGFSVRSIGPRSKIRERREEKTADYTLGRTVRISQHETTHESGISFNKGLAKNLLLTIKPDIIVFHEPLAGHAAHTLFSGAPKRGDGIVPCTIAQFHAQTERLGKATEFSLWLLKFIRRINFDGGKIPRGLTPGYINTIMGKIDGKIAVSNATAAFWNDIYPGEYKVIYNGINTSELTVDGLEIESWKEDGKKTILYAGRHDERKGLPYLLNAYGDLIKSGIDNIQLKLTGEGKETENLRRLVKERQLPNVEFVGNLPREKLTEAYRTADVFVSPAIGGEGFGRTLAESMACGTLPVGSDINGYREVIGYRPFARTVKPKDSVDLASKIVEVLNLPEEEKHRLGRLANEYVNRKFSWEIIAKQTIEFYMECLEKHGRPKVEEWPRKREKIIFEGSKNLA